MKQYGLQTGKDPRYRMPSSIRYIDLCAGIGGFRLGFIRACEELGQFCRCVYTAEINKKPLEVYSANFGETVRPVDVSTLETRGGVRLPDFDVMLAGFPCQGFSTAGLNKGLGDDRSQVFFDLVRILKVKKPPCFIFENVAALVTHDSGRSLEVILKHLNAAGYHTSYVILNAADFAVAQARKRIYFVGCRKPLRPCDLTQLSQPTDSRPVHRTSVRNILQSVPLTSDLYFDQALNAKLSTLGVDRLKSGVSFSDQHAGNSVHSWDLSLRGEVTEDERIVMNILAEHNQMNSPRGMYVRDFSRYTNLRAEPLLKRLERKGYVKQRENGSYIKAMGALSFDVCKIAPLDGVAHTLTATETHKMGVFDPRTSRVRRYTKREVARMFGFPDDFKLNVSESLAYRLLGNSVAIPVIAAVSKLALLHCFRSATKLERGEKKIENR